MLEPTVAGRKPLRPRARIGLEALEARDVPATSVLAVGADAGGGPRVTVFDQGAGTVLADFFAYDQAFTGGVRVATADLNADGTADVVTAPGAGIAATVKLFDGKTGGLIRELPALDGFTGGANLAVGDVTGDRVADVVVGADAGGGPRVQVFDGKTGAVVRDFFAFEDAFGGGVRVAVGDLTGDGLADIVTGAGATGGSAVRSFDAATGDLLSSFFADEDTFLGGVYVSAADLNADGLAEIVTGAGVGGGPVVRVLDGLAGTELTSFLAYDETFRGGVRVGAYSLDLTGRAGIVTTPGPDLTNLLGGTQVRLFNSVGGSVSRLFSALDSGFSGGAFAAVSTLFGDVTQLTGGELGNFFAPGTPTGPVLVTLNLDPLDVNLLGLRIQTSPITVTVSIEEGDGKLLGNLLGVVSDLVNLDGVNNALNTVLANAVDLLNSASLGLTTAVGPGPLDSAEVKTARILDLFVAPVSINLLGARIDTSSINLAITAQSGDGLVLGNALTALADLFNPPLPDRLDLAFINTRLADLLAKLEAQLPNLPAAPVPVVEAGPDNSQVLRLAVPPIDLNLLGLNLQTDTIRVNADALTGDGKLLGNVLLTLLNTLDATPQDIADLNNNLNGVLAKVIGVLNASNLTLAAGAVDALAPVLQTLSLADLINTSGVPQTTPVLNLTVLSPDGGQTPPVDLDLLGLKITTSDIRAQLTATTGEGMVLGNLVYNVSHLLDAGSSGSLLGILGELTG